MSTTKDHHNKAKALPETGNENSGSNNATLFGGLFAALGSLLLFGRRKNKINNTAYTRSVRPGFYSKFMKCILCLRLNSAIFKKYNINQHKFNSSLH